MSNKRHNHGQKAKVIRIPKFNKEKGDFVLGNFVLHPTKGYRKIRKEGSHWPLHWLLQTGGYAE